MTRQIALLRGINLGPHNRIPMPALRDALERAGMRGVRTYVQSGNVVLDSDVAPDELAGRCRRVIAEHFGLDIAVLTRTRDELARVVAGDPLAGVASDPMRYQVCFLEHGLQQPALERLQAAAAPEERLVAIGRELYAWHPGGIGRSKLWGRIAGPGLGVPATARNWTTVTTLLELAEGSACTGT